MITQKFSFAPERRSVQTTFYHFFGRSSGEQDRYGFSQQDTLMGDLNKIYQSKFADISSEIRNVLVSILVAYIPTTNRNLTMLAAANYIVFHMRNHRLSLNIDPNTFANSCVSPQTADTNICGSSQISCETNDLSVVSCKTNAVQQLDQQSKNIFDGYFNYVASIIMPDLTDKKPEEIVKIRALNKITLQRYIIYVIHHINISTNREQ